MLLKNKTAIITGANRGIGFETLKLFVQQGANIVVCCRTINLEFEDTIKCLKKKHGVNITICPLDLSSEESVKDASRVILDSKKADILVNCAGTGHGALFQRTSIKEIKNVFEINYFNQILFTQNIVRLMLHQQSGAIINVCSVAGIEGRKGNIAYGASKAALILATKTLSSEVAEKGIRVNAVAPGLIDTDMLSQMEENAREEILALSQMHRLGKPEEVAKVILFLASDMSSYITGQVVRVDGGM
jgi:3-oxoacyl-[acyl-carrier protein] reductase